MILSERGAIGTAIAGGGFSLYPAGQLTNIIKGELAGDDLKGNLDPNTTAEKIMVVQGPADPSANSLFKKDLSLLYTRLRGMNGGYDIESVFDKMLAAAPSMAERYYSIKGFNAPRPKIVEYFFEGYNDKYKDADFTAFNVNHAESHDLGVPVGTYFKRDQVVPGQPEYATLHEANHVMQEIAMMPEGIHLYTPWLDEGMADAFARMMLFRVTKDEGLLTRIKKYKAEIDVLDPRKVTYHYGEETVLLMLLCGGLPFVKALMRARKRDPFNIDLDGLANMIKRGADPHTAMAQVYKGNSQDKFRLDFDRDEETFRKDDELDEADLRIIRMFLASEPPACLTASEYSAALWLMDSLKNRSSLFIDPDAIPEGLRSQVPNWAAGAAMSVTSLPTNLWENDEALLARALIAEPAVPDVHKAGLNELANKYFIIKRELGNAAFFVPYGGGLPHRLATGEIRCKY